MSECHDLIPDLASPDPDLQREAARAAGEMICHEALPYLAKLIESDNLGVQEAAEFALRRIGGKEVVAAVIPLLRSDDAPVRNIAMDILRQVGSQDFPPLVDLLHDRDTDIRIFAADILGSVDNVMAVGPLCDALLKDPEVNVRYQAAVSLGGLAFKEAAKCLNKALHDEEWVQFAVIEALAKIRDDSSVGALLAALNTATDLVASMIVDALGEIGNIKAVAMLLKRMDASPPALRNKIVGAVVGILGGKSLGLLSPKEQEKFRDYMLAALTDEDESIQDAAIEGLGHVGGEEAAARVLDLAGGMDPDRDQDRLEKTVESLAAMGLTQALEDALSDANLAKALVACQAAGRVRGEKAASALMRAFALQDRDLQRAGVTALLGVAGPEAVEFFMDILRSHRDGTVIKAALKFLGPVMRHAPAGDLMLGLLAHPYNDVKEAALEACISLGGEEMAERFKAMAASEDPLYRLMAVHALGRLGAMEHLEDIRLALQDQVPDIRKTALEALGEIAKDSCLALDLLVDKLSDESREVRLTVVDLIGRCRLPQAQDHLLAALSDDDDWVRIRAMEALGRRGEALAVPKLVPLTGSDNKLLALKAVTTLGEIGGKAAFRALLELSSGTDAEIVDAAEAALARIQDTQEGER